MKDKGHEGVADTMLDATLDSTRQGTVKRIMRDAVASKIFDYLREHTSSPFHLALGRHSLSTDTNRIWSDLANSQLESQLCH